MKKYFVFVIFLVFVGSALAQSRRDSIDVLNYRISLTIPDFKQKHISGNTIVTLKPVFEGTKTISLDFLGLEIEKVLVNDKKYKNWSYNDSVLLISFKNELNKEGHLDVQVYYSGHPKEDKDWGGFYFSSVDAFNMGVGMASVPHSFGRVWFPCNDNFTDKATYDYYIRVNDKYVVSSGGKEIPVIMKPEGQTIYHWKQSNPIPTYLAAINVAGYEVIRDTFIGLERNIPIEIFTFSGKKEYTKKSLEKLKDVMSVYEELFGAYQWEKIGYSETSFQAGAMEHAENIAITSYAFNGQLNGESLIYHELSHSWFGNLVTCESAKDMWLNEGWASYCESIFMENIYGSQQFRDYNRARHFEVVHLAHQKDHGYRSVGNMDINFTYGTTIYEKGAEVVHTLRNYIGDSLFFPAVQVYLKKYAFSNANTGDLKNTLEEETGMKLDDFFDFWVFTKGFAHFEISDFLVKENDNGYEVYVKLLQRLVEADKYANSNRIEISFMDSSFNTVSRIFEFSGAEGKQSFEIPFYPALIMLDMYEKTSDATIDKYSFIVNKGEYVFDECLFDAVVTEISDTSFLRVISNCIEPNNSKMPGYLFQKKYYWTVEGIWNEDFEAKGRFYLTTLMDMNFTKLYKPRDFILMYRENMNEKWSEIESNKMTEYLEAELKVGQYAIAVKTYE
ncbi:MAG: M1 family metallopeptidase [Bacteroidales bacterium]|nr:M1 family metallopeptidase [Bacteroidales bacterium]